MSKRDRRDERRPRPRPAGRDRRDSQPDDEQQRRVGEGDLQEGDSLTALKAILSKVAALLKPLQPHRRGVHPPRGAALRQRARHGRSAGRRGRRHPQVSRSGAHPEHHHHAARATRSWWSTRPPRSRRRKLRPRRARRRSREADGRAERAPRPSSEPAGRCSRQARAERLRPAEPARHDRPTARPPAPREQTRGRSTDAREPDRRDRTAPRPERPSSDRLRSRRRPTRPGRRNRAAPVGS